MDKDKINLAMERKEGEEGVFSSGMGLLNKTLKGVFILLTVLIALLLIWFFTFSGFFTVKPDTAVITLHFGEFKNLYKDSWHWVFPYPVSRVIEIPTSPQTITSNTFMPANIKLITERKSNMPPMNPNGPVQGMIPGVDGYLITADACIIHTAWSMTYRITNPVTYYEKCMTPVSPKDPDARFKNADGEDIGSRGPRTMLKAILDNAVIQETALWNANDIIFSSKVSNYARDVESRVVKQITDMDIGVSVESVILVTKSPPPPTIDAFDEVLQSEIQAGAVKERAEVYSTEQLALAETGKNQILAEAENYKRRVVSEVEADAVYFKSLLAEYKKNPSAVTVSLFSQTVAEAMSDVKDKFIVNAMPDGHQELRLKLNPEPKDQTPVEDPAKKNNKEAAK